MSYVSYSNQTDDSSDHQSDTESSIKEIIKERAAKNKALTTKSKRQNEVADQSTSKKAKTEKKSFKEKLNGMITAGKFNDTSDIVDSLSINQGDKTYHFKSVSSSGDNYWIIQHYKMSNIADVAMQDRWRHSECSIKLITSDKNSKDKSIDKKLNAVVDEIVERFMDDPKMKTSSNKKKNLILS